MAKTYDVNEEFIRYQEEIASSPVYEGMPDLRNEWVYSVGGSFEQRWWHS